MKLEKPVTGGPCWTESGAALGRVSKVPSGPRRLARRLAALSGNRPTSKTSIGLRITVPPAAWTASAVVFASATAKDTFQATGCDS